MLRDCFMDVSMKRDCDGVRIVRDGRAKLPPR